MYKDIEKQKEAAKERQRRYREKQKGVTLEGVTDKALQGVTQPEQAIAIPEGLPEILHSRYMREAGYRQVIDRLIANTIDQLHAMRVFIPVWRYNLG